jgi:hypothetical protein
MGTPCQLICMGYLKLTTVRTEYLDNWICNETLFRLLNAHLPLLKNNTFKFTRKLLVQTIVGKAGLFHSKNKHGLFIKQFQTSCPFDDMRRRVTYFYWQISGKPPDNPVCALDIHDVHARSNQIRRNAIRGLVNNTQAEISPCRNEAAAAAATMMSTTMTPWRS